MNKKWLPAIGTMALLAGALAACGPAAPTPTTPPQKPTLAWGATPPAAGSILINGAGATFPFPLYSRWFYEYAFVDPSARFNYQSIGSGGGIKQITAKTVDFGASDAILTGEQYKAAPGIQMVPTVAGAVVPVYNLKGITQGLKLDADAIAGIYLGKIKRWNDPALVTLNPDLKLPNQDIIVVHRADGSGTTFIWTGYLSAVSREWKEKVGTSTSVNWPTGLGGKGNEGVAGTVQQNDGAIGYVELAYARQNKLATASVKNAAGNVVAPTLEATTAAMADFGDQMPDTLALSIVNAPGAKSWPVAGYTYLLVYRDQQDCAKAQRLVSFVKWGLTDGTRFATELDYAPLADNVKAKVLERVSKITCQGKPMVGK